MSNAILDSKTIPTVTPLAELTEHVMSRNPQSRCSECGWGNVAWKPKFCVGCGVCETCASKTWGRCTNASKSGYQSIPLRTGRGHV